VCVNPRDGTELFRHEWKTDFGVNAPTPIHKDGKFLLCSGYNHGMALVDIRAGVVWEKPEVAMQFQSPVLFEGHLYFISGKNGSKEDAKIQCLEWSSGAVKWSHNVKGSHGSVIVAGDKLIALTENGEVILAEASAAGYKELGRIQEMTGETWSAPAFSDRRLFVRNNAGTLVCLDLTP